MTTTTTPATGTDRTARRLAGVLAAPVAALAAHLVLTQGLDIDLRAGGRTVGWSSVLIAAVVAGSAGWLVVAGLERLGGNQRRRWSMLSLVVLALSLPGPLLEGETPVVGLGLVALHLLVAAVVIPTLAPSSPGTGEGGTRRLGEEGATVATQQ